MKQVDKSGHTEYQTVYRKLKLAQIYRSKRRGCVNPYIDASLICLQ
jgi:hypothetical protein